jgi:two-component system CheB/CheR fusion protein
MRRLLERVFFAFAAILLIVSGSLALQNLSRINRDIQGLSSVSSVITSLQRLSGLLKQSISETMQFVLTGDENHRVNFTQQEADVAQILGALRTEQVVTPTDLEGIRSLEAAFEAMQNVQVRTVEMRQQGLMEQAADYLSSSTTSLPYANIDQIISTLQSDARDRQVTLLATSEVHYHYAWVTALILTSSALTMVGGLVWAIFRQRSLTERNRELGEQIRWFLEQISDYAIFMMDAECRATTWNKGVQEVLGYAEHEFLYRDVRPLIFTPEAHAAGVVKEEFEKAAENGSASDDRWMKRKDDSKFWASGITTSIRDRSGKLVGFSKVMRDMTEQKLNSDQLTSLAAELSQESRRKNDFLATLAHELRNPLSPIKNAVELMSMMPLDAQLSDLRVLMNRHVEQLVHLIDDLMDISRIGRGKIDLKRQIVDIQSVIDEAVESSRLLIENNEQLLKIDVPEEPLLVEVDRTRMTQVICNLLNNASKYSDMGCSITLTAKKVAEHAEIVVQDNGNGISPERINDIFEMYSQIEDSIERGTAGLGIGLTLVRTIVELHGGTVTAVSEGVDKGSTFTITLPIVTKRTSVDTIPTNLPSNSDTITPQRILVVDDMRALSFVLSSLLKTLGHEVMTVASGKAAIEALETFEADIVFSDIAMPKMTGYELAEYLRKNYKRRPLTLVAMTGYGQASDRERALAAGFDEHMVKPVDFSILKRFFRQLETSQTTSV